jgi:hypothetical protein
MDKTIWTTPTRELKRVPDMSAGTRGEVVITETTGQHEGKEVVLFSAPGRVGVYVLAADLISGQITHAECYDAVLNGNTVSQPHNSLQ